MAELKCIELKNVEGKPIFYITIGNKLLTTIYPGVADIVKIDAKNLKLYKGEDEVISFKRFFKPVPALKEAGGD